MNNTFSLKRFGLLMRKHWMEKRKFYLAGMGAYTAIMLIIYTTQVLNYDTVTTHNPDFQAANYLTGLFIGGIIYAGLMFTDYNRKETGIFNLLLPASLLEKTMVYYILWNILFLACVFALFYTG